MTISIPSAQTPIEKLHHEFGESLQRLEAGDKLNLITILSMWLWLGIRADPKPQLLAMLEYLPISPSGNLERAIALLEGELSTARATGLIVRLGCLL